MTFSEFIVTHAPEHVQFVKDSEELPLSEIQDVISLTFGFDVDKVMMFDNGYNSKVNWLFVWPSVL